MKDSESEKTLSPIQRDALLQTLRARFENNTNRHPGVAWTQVLAKLKINSAKLWSLNMMEATGGEPDLVTQEAKNDALIFIDCSAQTPSGRISLCYDEEALAARKEHKPKGSAIGMAAVMGVELLTEEEYFELQQVGDFDTKRSSWIKTPPDIRKLGGAIYGTRSYGRVFVGCNSAESYYSGRGFRGLLRL